MDRPAQACSGDTRDWTACMVHERDTASNSFAKLMHPPAGKTMLVESLAAEAGTPLLCLSPSSLLSKWAGESEKTLRAAFEAAAALSPSILFIDEVDSLAPARWVLARWLLLVHIYTLASKQDPSEQCAMTRPPSCQLQPVPSRCYWVQVQRR
jgi:hypothetical protein